MQAGTSSDHSLVAWNGIRLHIPASWDARVSGQHHLVFEKEFLPQLQLRWEKSTRHPHHSLRKRLTQVAVGLGPIVPDGRVPLELQHLRNSFGPVTCYQDDQGTVRGGVCLCPACQTIILFHLPEPDRVLLEEVGACLTSLSCHGHKETLWRVQGLSLALPPPFILKEYSFGAGLTRLSFRGPDLLLHTCALGPADARLSRQSLEEVLIALTGAADLEILSTTDETSRAGYRMPSLPRQILFRLRRERPFIQARIRHATAANRLLAVVCHANRPIPLATLHAIDQRYETVPTTAQDPVRG